MGSASTPPSKHPALRCPRHDEWIVVDGPKKMRGPMDAFVRRHDRCGPWETYENGERKCDVVPRGSRN